MGGRRGKRISGIFPKKKEFVIGKVGNPLSQKMEEESILRLSGCQSRSRSKEFTRRMKKGSEFGRNVVSFSQVQLRVLN